MAETSKEPWQSRNRFAVPKACVTKLNVEEYKLKLLWSWPGKLGLPALLLIERAMLCLVGVDS